MISSSSSKFRFATAGEVVAEALTVDPTLAGGMYPGGSPSDTAELEGDDGGRPTAKE